MKNLATGLKDNMILFVELFFVTILFGLNIFIGLEIYEAVIGDVAPVTTTEAQEIIKIPALDSENLTLFEENQESKKEFIKGVKEDYTNRWQLLSKQSDPFLR